MRFTRGQSRFIVALWLLPALVAMATVLVRFRIDNSVGVWFAADDPALQEYRQVLTDFGPREWLLVVLEQTDAPDAARATDRSALVASVRVLPDVHGILSAADAPPGSALYREFLKPDADASREGLWVQVTNDLDRADGYREALLDAIRGAAVGHPTITAVRIAGTAVINGELNRAARRDMMLFFPAVVVFLTLLGLFVFRNWRDTAVLLAVSLGTVVLIAGAMAGAGYAFNMVTIMLPTVLIALSVADAVHLIHAFHLERHVTDSSVAAARAARAVLWPCAGTSATTIAGFLAFAGSSVLPIFQLAVFASLGIALAWVLTMTAAPALLTLLWARSGRPAAASAPRADRMLARCWDMLARFPRAVVAVFVLIGLSLAGLTALRADTDYVTFFRRGTRVPTDYRALEQAGFPQNPLTLVVRARGGQAVLAPHTVGSLHAFADSLERLPGIRAVLSPFTLVELGGGPEQLVASGLMTPAGDQVQLVVMMDHPSSQQLLQLLPRIQIVAAYTLPAGFEVMPTGTSLLWARMDDGVIQTQKASLVLVTFACFLILAWLFRSLPLAALGLVASLYPVAVVLGAMGLLGIPVNMATVLIAGIAVGLAVDDTIHFIHAWQHARRDGADTRSASRGALRNVGPRMIATSAILIGAFATMGLSDFLPTAQFGLLSSLTIALALAADLALVPVLLGGGRRTAAAAATPLTRSV